MARAVGASARIDFAVEDIAGADDAEADSRAAEGIGDGPGYPAAHAQPEIDPRRGRPGCDGDRGRVLLLQVPAQVIEGEEFIAAWGNAAQRVLAVAEGVGAVGEYVLGDRLE